MTQLVAAWRPKRQSGSARTPSTANQKTAQERGGDLDLAASPNGELHLIWTDEIEGVMYTNHSVDGWSAPQVLVPNNSTPLNNTVLAVGSNGKVHLTYNTEVAHTEGNFQDVFYYGEPVPETSTKRYYAGGIQVATRVDSELVYNLHDPSGMSLVMADVDGNEVGRMLYDGYGGVLTSTVPITLTGAVADVPDATTGLVYQGGGRWYDPALGRPLQPNTASGPPTLPQALNRYAATPVGQPGVYEAANDSFLSNWTQDNWYRQFASASFACTTCVLSEIKVTQQLYRPRFTIGTNTWIAEDVFRKVGKDTYENINNGQIWTEEQFLFATFDPDDLSIVWTGSRKVDNILKRILANTTGRIALNVGVSAIFDVGFEALEATTGTGRWANPYWTNDQKLWQAGFAIGGDLAIVAAIAWWNPTLWVGIPVYAAASITWSYVHPVIFPGQFVEVRNLAPLQP